MADTEVKIEMEKYKPKWYVNFADFANMVKAFIGSNYLSIAYAFLQSGLVLGLCGMALIAGLTDYCCHLIVKTKHHIIRKHLEKLKKTGPTKKNNYSSIKGSTTGDSGLEDESYLDDVDEEISSFVQSAKSEEVSSDTESEESLSDLEEHMMKHLTYGEIGKKCYGSKGLGMVNFFIALTQFGFCVGYFIFIGNTVHAIFPYELCYTAVTNLTICHTYYDLDEVPKLNTTTQVDEFFLTHPNYEFLNADPNSTTLEPSNFSTTTVPGNLTTTTPPSNTTGFYPMDILMEIRRNKPNLMILVAAPLPIFLMFSLIRNVRTLGLISVVANACILGGCVAVFAFLMNGFDFHHSVELVKIRTFPVFFGMVTAAFEGIGLVIPIESSMVGNRNLFPCFLHGAIAVLTFILGGFGVLGYLKFGDEVHQMLNTNIPAGEVLSDIVNMGICIGILLTFPLQIYPVIEILEKYIFSEGSLCGPKAADKKKSYREAGDEKEKLLGDDDKDPLLTDDEEVVTAVSSSVPRWKRNILRFVVVMFAGGLAILLKDFFAYVGAFVGAVGSSVLAFILPCLFHLKVCWDDTNVFIKMKDVFIICFGVVASVISVVSVIERIATNSLSH